MNSVTAPLSRDNYSLTHLVFNLKCSPTNNTNQRVLMISWLLLTLVATSWWIAWPAQLTLFPLSPLKIKSSPPIDFSMSPAAASTDSLIASKDVLTTHVDVTQSMWSIYSPRAPSASEWIKSAQLNCSTRSVPSVLTSYQAKDHNPKSGNSMTIHLENILCNILAFFLIIIESLSLASLSLSLSWSI